VAEGKKGVEGGMEQPQEPSGEENSQEAGEGEKKALP
jgi:hypothetical protein